MATCNLMASFPGNFTREGMIVGNPEVIKNAFTPAAGSFSATPDLSMSPGFKGRVLSIVVDAAVDVLQLSENETIATYAGQPTRVPAPVSGNVSYACFLHESTVAVHVRTP